MVAAGESIPDRDWPELTGRGSYVDIVAIANWVTTVTLVIGVGFTIVQLRQNARQQRHEAVLELVNSFRTREFSEALHYLAEMPPGIPDAELRQRLGDRITMATALGGTWEAFGILVYRGDIDITIFEDFFSGPITFSWSVLQDFAMQIRKQTQRETIFEWFQWLAERVAEREEKKAPVPAHIEFRDWRPPRSR